VGVRDQVSFRYGGRDQSQFLWGSRLSVTYPSTSKTISFSPRILPAHRPIPNLTAKPRYWLHLKQKEQLFPVLKEVGFTCLKFEDPAFAPYFVQPFINNRWFDSLKVIIVWLKEKWFSSLGFSCGVLVGAKQPLMK